MVYQTFTKVLVVSELCGCDGYNGYTGVVEVLRVLLCLGCRSCRSRKSGQKLGRASTRSGEIEFRVDLEQRSI